jgi:predicted methyltransferase
LKRGGVFGVEEHRAAPDDAGVAAIAERIGKKGYVPEAYVVDLARQAGFKLEARSEVNANPRDTQGLAARGLDVAPDLAPRRSGSRQVSSGGRERRMTLRFRKP